MPQLVTRLADCRGQWHGGLRRRGGYRPSLPLESCLALAAVGHLSRYRGMSRAHTESDLQVFFNRCQDRHLGPRIAQRNDLEL